MTKKTSNQAIGQMKSEIRQFSSVAAASSSRRFFKEIADEFWGARVPDIRACAKRHFNDLTLSDISELLGEKVHELKYAAMEALVFKYEHAKKLGAKDEQKKIVEFYLKNARRVDNWDLVDTSASYVLGDYLGSDVGVLSALVSSDNIWERRIAVIGTHAEIRRKNIGTALIISAKLLSDKEDLIHKAVGWTLREVWKVNPAVTEDFLKKHYDQIPRTTLRYAIERMDKDKKQIFLKKKF